VPIRKGDGVHRIIIVVRMYELLRRNLIVSRSSGMFGLLRWAFAVEHGEVGV
jgi:hypothetical protein